MPLSEKEELELLELEEEEYQAQKNNGMADSVNAEPYPKLKSFGAGLTEGASFGFPDELAGAASALGVLGKPQIADVLPGGNIYKIAKQAKKYISGEENIQDKYRATRDYVRNKFEEARKGNPKTFLGGELAGAVSTALIPGTQGATAAKGASVLKNLPYLAETSALQSLGSSEADLTKDEFEEAGKDVLKGTAAGVAVGVPLGVAIQKIFKYAGPVLEKVEKHIGAPVMSFLFGPSAEAISTKLKSPEIIANAPSKEALGRNLASAANKIEEQIASLSEKARGTLSDFAPPPQALTKEVVGPYGEKIVQNLDNPPPDFGDSIAKPDILDEIGRIREQLSVAGGGLVGEAATKADKLLSNIMRDISSVGGDSPALSQRSLKDIITQIDKNTDWERQGMEVANNAFKAIRQRIDSILKQKNPAYAEAMSPVAERMDTIQNLKNLFSLKKETGGGLVPTDATFGKFDPIVRERRPVSRDYLKDVEKYTGEDFAQKAKESLLAREFESATISGARRTLGFGTAGATLGGAVAGPPGAAVGSFGGAMAGMAVDKFGGKIANKMLDYYLKMKPERLGKYAPLLINAAQRGAQQLETTNFILQQRDPEYNQMISNLQNEEEGEQ